MILIGHSQGELLSKLAVVDSGNTFWDSSSLGPFEELRASAKEEEEILRRSLFFTPVSSIKELFSSQTLTAGASLPEV